MAQNQKQNSKLPEGVTQEQVDQWKKQYGEDAIHLLKLPLGETAEAGTFHCIARTPNRVVVGEYQKYAEKKPQKASDILLKNCLLTGLEKVQNDDGLYWAAVMQLADLIPLREGETETL